MKTFYTTVVASIAAILFLTGFVPGTGFVSGVWGQTSPQLPFGGELRGIVRVRGYIVCTDCTLREVRKNQPALTGLYQLNHEQKRAVMKVEWVNERAWWQSIVGLSHRLQVRGAENVIQKLWAEENLFEDLEIIGLLRTTRMFDVNDVVLGTSEQ
jgi:hypothetical protein